MQTTDNYDYRTVHTQLDEILVEGVGVRLDDVKLVEVFAAVGHSDGEAVADQQLRELRAQL